MDLRVDNWGLEAATFIFYFLCERLCIYFGRDQSAVDQPNRLAEDQPLCYNTITGWLLQYYYRLAATKL